MNKKFFDKVGKAKLTISRTTCNTEDDYISIEVRDNLSSIVFFEAKIDLKSFAQCITGLSQQPIEFGIRGFENIGRKLETKSEEVQIPDNSMLFMEHSSIKEAVAVYEIDGWKGRWADCFNHHNHLGNNKYRVHYYRWVEIKEE